MKKFLLFFLLQLCIAVTYAQKNNEEAFRLITQNQDQIGISDADLANSLVSDYIPAKGNGQSIVYLQQAYAQIPVYNQLMVLAFRDGKFLSKSGGRLKGFENKVALQPHSPAKTAAEAVKIAMAEKNIFPVGYLTSTPGANGKTLSFGKAGACSEDITAELLWLPYNKNKEVKLAWQVFLTPLNSSDYWLIRVDAITGQIINETNLTVSCNWSKDARYSAGILDRKNAESGVKKELSFTKLFKVDLMPAGSPDIVNNASYIVVPFPAESPKHPGGAPASVNNPWTHAPGNATSLRWHNNGSLDFNFTRGNNVWAAEDRAAANNSAGQVATSTTNPDPLTFNFTPNFGVAPTQRTPVPNQQFNITNLFYWNNLLHDISYQYGFDEASGNFQANNQGRGGLGNDYVIADAQDGAGTQNANFSTPADGAKPRMQMYLWDTAASVVVNSPAAIAGNYSAVESAFSSANQLAALGPVTAAVAWFNDNTTGLDHEACGTSATSLTGKIALLNRGTCNFTVKVKNAQIAGAVGVIVINNVAGDPIRMGGSDNTITIPAVMVSQDDGQTLSAALAGGLNVTLGAAVIDGDADNGIVTHEFSHGVSGRLTGGPSQSGCLGNAENMGEGWSDYFALMMTQNWAFSTLGDGFGSPRGMGTYAIGQSINGSGIRSQKYCTDMMVNNKVYASSIPAESHDRGEIWCAVLWDMTWNIINQVGSISINLFDANATGGNVIAYKLVMEGLKLQPCQPGFIDGRNAIIQADINLYGGAHLCAIREAFRRRGMGPNASQGSSDNVNDQVPDFSPALKVELTQSVNEVQEGNQVTYTNTVSTCNAVNNYLLTDTLPSNVTYISGGNFNAATRVVSFPVTLAAGGSQAYSFTVSVNAGAYYDPSDIINEPFSGTSIPAIFTATSTTPATWSISNAQSASPPSSAFTKDTSVVSVQTLATTNSISLPANQSALTFMHRYNTESGYDGGVIEISTNDGTTWTGLKNKMILNPYQLSIDATSGTVLAGKEAFTGNSGGFIKTAINLSGYAGQNIRLRWLFSSDDGTGGTGWYVDDINLKHQAVVNMRSSLYPPSGARVSFSDTVTLILPPGCTDAAIANQPANQTVCAGADASFTVTSTGSSVQYQWQVSTDGGASFNNINGATSATLTLTGVTGAMNNNRYRVIASNTCPSSTTSSSALLNVTLPAQITGQPQNITVCEGLDASFSVNATGTSNAYQWQVSADGGTTFSNITGATSAILTITPVTAAMNNNLYRVAISSCSPVPLNSSAATLTVNTAASITTQPANVAACSGNNANITVVASGTGVSYQWQISTNGGAGFTDIPGATSAALVLTSVTNNMNGYQYHVVVTGTACPSTVTSNNVTLSVTTAANISSQPVNQTVCAGSAVSFVASATGVSYQWQVSTDGGTTYTDISGATTSTLSLPSVSASMNNNLYRLAVTSCGPDPIYTNAASLSVNSPASITTQPSATAKCVGDNLTLSVTASGTGISYQWQISTDGGASFTNLTGATGSSLVLNNLQLSQNGNIYHVVISSAAPCTPVSSANAALVVNTIPVVGITVQPTDIVCAGTNMVLSGTGAATYSWNNGVQNNTAFPISQTTTFTVTGTTVSGCVSTATQTITVNPLPVVTISASPYQNLLSGQTTTITAVANQPGDVYGWTKNGSPVPGQTTHSITVDESGLGTYVASFTDANGCTGFSNQLAIGDSVVSISFIYPNPNQGQFLITPPKNGTGNQRFQVVMYNAAGAKVIVKEAVVNMSNPKIEMHAPHLSHGVYMVTLRDDKGKVVAKGKVTIL